MKRILLFAIMAISIVGCNMPQKPSQEDSREVFRNRPYNVYHDTYSGHKYIVVYASMGGNGVGVSITHDEACPCKSKKTVETVDSVTENEF